jgi:DNA-binding MarR family transcriptional regulator
MMEHEGLIILLKNNPRQAVKNLAEGLDTNKIFTANNLKALEDQGYIKSKRVKIFKVYFKKIEGG